MAYVSATDMVMDARNRKYAVGHFNLNNMEFIRAFLLAAQETQSPMILGVSGSTAKYMGGYRSIVGMVKPFIDHLAITVPVALHADHSSFEQVLDAIDAGFSSVMFDGSSLPFEENLRKSEQLVEICRKKGISLECEVNGIGGEEDGVVTVGGTADPEQCRRLGLIGIDMLAAGVGNIHGKYPADWPGLHFDLLEEIARITDYTPLVLHGGSQIPANMLRRAIALGISKINVNTECQMAFAAAVREYIEQGKDRIGTGYSLQALLSPGVEAIQRVAMDKMMLFGSVGKA